jgi:hypothetical protein
MPFPTKPLIVLAGLLVAGAPRLWFEDGLTRELHAARLLPRPVSTGAREKIDQTSWAVALGGLRTLVATFLNLRAQGLFEDTRWDELAEAYDTLVEFAPQTRDYWLTGAWHQGVNAASYYAYDSDLPALRRKAAWRAAILRGRAFLERGIRNNPVDGKLRAALGNQLADVTRLPDFPAAAAAFHAAAERADAPPYLRRAELYALARSPGRDSETLRLARELYADRANRTPLLVAIRFVFEHRADPAEPADRLAVELFGSAKAAYAALGPYWQREQDQYPSDGVAEALAGLERQLAILPDRSVFRRPPAPLRKSTDPFAR